MAFETKGVSTIIHKYNIRTVMSTFISALHPISFGN